MMSVPEAAKVLGLAPDTVRGQLRKGKLRGRKIGRVEWFIEEAEVERYRLENKRTVAT